MFAYLLKGVLIGLTVAIPVGPMGLLCLDMTVSHGRRTGLSCSMGMVIADIVSASIMLMGIGLLYAVIVAHETSIRIGTGLFFTALGIYIYCTRYKKRPPPSNTSLAGLSLTSFLLSISPATFALMLFLFPALGLTQQYSVLPILIGVALGSATWCSVILGAGHFIRKCLGDKLASFKGVVGWVFIFAGLFSVTVTAIKYFHF